MAEENEEMGCECLEIHEDLLKIVNETMPDEEELYDLADLFKVFADSTRIRILFVLFEAEVCVCDLAKALNMTQSAVSHQLRILKQNKLVKNRRAKVCWHRSKEERQTLPWVFLEKSPVASGLSSRN